MSAQDGRPARIILWNAKNEKFPIIALVTSDTGTEAPRSYTTTGKFHSIETITSPADLYLTRVCTKKDYLEKVKDIILDAMAIKRVLFCGNPIVTGTISDESAEKIVKQILVLDTPDD